MSAKPGRAHHKKHAAHDEEHENHERWLVTYADMLTLLMVLFIVMFAISQVDQKKFAALRDGLARGFGAPSVAFSDPGTAVQDGQAGDSPLNLYRAALVQPRRIRAQFRHSKNVAQPAKDLAGLGRAVANDRVGDCRRLR